MRRVRSSSRFERRERWTDGISADAFSFFANSVAKPLEGEDDEGLGSGTGADTPQKISKAASSKVAPKASAASTSGPPKARTRRTPAQMQAAREAGEPLRLPKKKKVVGGV